MSHAKAEPSSAEPSHQAEPPVLNGPDLERRFHELVSEWRADVAPLSSSAARARHPAYRAIIALGPRVVQLLLRELQQRPNHWFAALRSLTGADPVPASDRGRIGAMTEAWVAWGKEHGYL